MNGWLTGGAIAIALGASYLIDSYGYDRGHAEATAAEQAKLHALKEEHSDLRDQAAQDYQLAFKQQVTRANAAEERLMATLVELETLEEEISERIPDVTTVYRTAPQAAPVAIPHCVFTRGWLRDYNAALGATARVPASRTGTASAAAEEAAEPAPGSDAELLESGVSPADILAHARDYGAWARGNLAQLNGLLDLHNTPPEE
ncbi:lysis protein [uncultured Halopseudomonas sp.]|uniref:lysis protein n=1 Tax=uncultured Halopseudomonas sp. TaxID=2901193 RepID=UPI0030EE3F96|tara:strand:- start:4082 stop:4690 length:609 start_codon:yes stop_codon:yes gene_type:complete